MKAQRHQGGGGEKVPPPPPMQSPTLAAWRVSPQVIRRDRWPALAILLVLFGLFPLFGSSELVDWVVALGLAVIVWLLTGRAQRRKGVSVGRDWLCVSGTWGRGWVATDRLTELKWKRGGYFSMRDQDGRGLVIDPRELRGDDDVFRVFVSAVRRSIAGGLTVDPVLREELGVE